MIRLIKVISTRLDAAVRFVKFYYRGKSDVRDVQEFSPFGIDGNPLKDMVAICVQTGQDGKSFVIGYLNKNQMAAAGELRLYSLDADGKQKTYQWFKADGTIEIMGDSDNMVRYSKLESAFNELKGDFNTLVTKYNAHTHPIGSPSTGPPSVTGSPSTADITPAKIKEIKTLK